MTRTVTNTKSNSDRAAAIRAAKDAKLPGAVEAKSTKPTRKAKPAAAAKPEKPTRKASSGKGKVIARQRPAGHSDGSVSAWFEAQGMNPKTQRAKLRRTGLNAPYSLADVKRVCGA